MKLYYPIILLALLFSFSTKAQTTDLHKPTLIIEASYMQPMPSIAWQIEHGQFVPGEDINKTVNPKRRDANRTVPGKGLPAGPDPLWQQQTNQVKYPSRETLISFEVASSGVTPTDPTGAVGPNHFVNSWNSSFRIWDKEGNPLTDAASLATIFPGQTSGDPIVMYDQIADRFIVTQFYSNGFLVAISQGPDPVNDGWFTYQFPTDVFPDYPKFSTWSDGYYITSNKNSGSAGNTEVVYAIERDKIIAGDPTAQMVGFPLPGIQTSGFYSPLGFNVNGTNMPPAGDAPVVYMQDDEWSGVSTDHLKVWTINVDWENPENSTISDPLELDTEPFDGLFDGGSFSNLPQPSGPDLDALQATIMYMAQYRRFDTHNSAVFNFVVDLDGNDDYAGIRWYELRQASDGDDWEIYQEGTYSQPDGHSAYSGNMCMDSDGNIALAYTIVSSEQHPSLRYTGRFSSDELGTMTLEEGTIVDGNQSDPSFRYGDYSQMTIDPVDDKTFWSIGEYFTGGTRKNQVGAFKIASDFLNDVGVVAVVAPKDGTLSDADTVTVILRNFGFTSQYEFPVSYQIDGGDIITELFTDTIHSNSNVTYTFMTTGDFSTEGQTYALKSFTALEADENVNNDTINVSVTYLYPNNLGVSEVSSPQSGSGLTDAEPVTVTIENEGGEPQTGFSITYVLNDNEPVTEQVDSLLMSGSNMNYTFESTVDLSVLGDYYLKAYTSIEDDSDLSNDTISIVITHEMCQPNANCTEGDGIARFELGDIVNPSGCSENGYADYTDMSTNLWPGATDEMIITTNYGDQYVKAWIDLNDNFVFENEEVIVDNFIIAEGQGNGTFTEAITFLIPDTTNLGEHLMRVKTNWNNPVPEDACEGSEYGETEDYTVSIDNTTAVGNKLAASGDLIVSNLGNNHFLCQLDAAGNRETLIFTVHNLSGQTIIQNRVQNINGTYRYDFDMSYAPKGLYLIRMGSESFGKVKKILVN